LDELLVQTLGTPTQGPQQDIPESEDSLVTGPLAGTEVRELDVEKIPVRVGGLLNPDFEVMRGDPGTGHSRSDHLHFGAMTLECVIHFLVPVVQGEGLNHTVPDPVDQIPQDPRRNAGIVRTDRRGKQGQETEQDQEWYFHGFLLSLNGYE
jgi:hypothetical protein